MTQEQIKKIDWTTHCLKSIYHESKDITHKFWIERAEKRKMKKLKIIKEKLENEKNI